MYDWKRAPLGATASGFGASLRELVEALRAACGPETLIVLPALPMQAVSRFPMPLSFFVQASGAARGAGSPHPPAPAAAQRSAAAQAVAAAWDEQKRAISDEAGAAVRAADGADAGEGLFRRGGPPAAAGADSERCAAGGSADSLPSADSPASAPLLFVERPRRMRASPPTRAALNPAPPLTQRGARLRAARG